MWDCCSHYMKLFLFLPRYSNSSFRAMPLCEKHCWQMRAYLQQGWRLQRHGLHRSSLSILNMAEKGLAKLTNSFKGLSSGWGVTSSHLFCGPSPTRYSMTLSTVPLSLGRTGLANGGPGGCMPAKTTNAQIKSRTKTNARQPSRGWQEPTYTWHWWARGPGRHLDRGSESGSLRGSSWSWEGNTFCRDSNNGWPGDLLALTFYIHNPVNADIPALWDWYKVLILLVCVR